MSNKMKQLRKRYADPPSPEKMNDHDKSYRKKKRCVEPVWNTSRSYDEDNFVLSDEDITEGVRMVEIKVEHSSEGHLVPYPIKQVKDTSRYTHPKSKKNSTSSESNKSSGKRRSKEMTHRTSALDIPVLGLSTFRIKSIGLVNQAINAAIEYGYRLFDTGAHYDNERELGRAFRDILPDHRLAREDIYIISKLVPGCVCYEMAMDSGEQTLRNLQTDYVDVMLLFWPDERYCDGLAPGDAMLDCYRALEDLYYAGKIKNIGVYKFTTGQLEFLLRRCHVVPAMLQAEFHPYYYRKSLVDVCRNHSIRMQAFCFIKCITDPVIINLSRRYKKAPAQIVLRWIIQHGVGVLPKSKNPSHILENADVFDFSLSIEDVELINDLNRDKSFTPGSHPGPYLFGRDF